MLMFCFLATLGLAEEELLKLWKGLFYCMWFSDKPLVQVCDGLFKYHEHKILVVASNA